MKADEIRQHWLDMPDVARSHERFILFEIAAQLAELNDTLTNLSDYGVQVKNVDTQFGQMPFVISGEPK